VVRVPLAAGGGINDPDELSEPSLQLQGKARWHTRECAMGDYFYNAGTQIHTIQLSEITPPVWGASVFYQPGTPKAKECYGYGESETEAIVNALEKANVPLATI
jgi:hypothetical protein